LVERKDPYPLHQTNNLYHNQGEGRFIEVTEQGGENFSLSEVSRGVAVGDIENDGDADLLISNNSGPVRLLINERGNAVPWTGVRVMARNLSRDAFGSQVAIRRSDGSTTWRRVGTDGSYASARDARILVGLGDQPEVELIEISAHDGGSMRYQQPPKERYIILSVAPQESPSQ
jgi:hypothetical protein